MPHQKDRVKFVPDDTLEVSNKVGSGEVWVKITQGDISRSEIQKVHIPNNDSQTINLNQWNSGEISIWLVVKEGTNGEITIKHN